MGSMRAACFHWQSNLPDWLPDAVRVYLAHTEGGESIRAIARAAGRHPSTVLRQIRRTETLRDDPLADAALARLGRAAPWRAGSLSEPPTAQDKMPMKTQPPDDATFARETLRVLKTMMEPKTLLVIAEGVEDAVVVHNAGDDRPVRRAVVVRAVAEALVLREFIAGQVSGRLARYTITGAGRSEVSRLLAQTESRRAASHGAGDDADVVDAADRFGGRAAPEMQAAGHKRPVGADAPLHVLAKRRRSNGEAYLPPALVAAALRFREAYEISRIGGTFGREWGNLVAGRVGGGGAAAPGAPTRRLEAEEALAAAIRALGPDLAEPVILAVCQEDGMEEIESRLDFPARSGKIVLRIALRALARHYARVGSDGYDLIY